MDGVSESEFNQALNNDLKQIIEVPVRHKYLMSKVHQEKITWLRAVNVRTQSAKLDFLHKKVLDTKDDGTSETQVFDEQSPSGKDYLAEHGFIPVNCLSSKEALQ
nr:epimerase family protein SDR39U1 homolog, chloroplastic isoform X2 [Ipomoea batatas]